MKRLRGLLVALVAATMVVSGAAPALAHVNPQRLRQAQAGDNRPDCPERTERPDRRDRPARPERPERPDRPDCPERPERSDRPERPSRR